MSDDMKPDVIDCEEELDLHKKKVNKKPHKIKSSGEKTVVKSSKNNESHDSVEEDEKELFTVNDSNNKVVLPKNSKTKEKKEKVGQMCQICGQIFKSLQAHLYVHDIFPKFECNICSKKFRHKANVLSHMKIHTNQR